VPNQGALRVSYESELSQRSGVISNTRRLGVFVNFPDNNVPGCVNSVNPWRIEFCSLRLVG